MLHRRHNDLAIGPERDFSVFQRLAILLHRRHNDLAIGPERNVPRVFERLAILLHRRHHDLASDLEMGSSVP